MSEGSIHHESVLVKEVLVALACRPNVQAIFLDCTVGMGGHSEAILKATIPHGRVVGMDRDEEALRIAQNRLAPYKDRVTLCKGSFKELLEIAKKLGVVSVSGILFDCGVSSMQFQSAERGFSFQTSGPLDMRMDRHLPHTAADLVNTLCESDLADLIYRYGEERRSRRIAKVLVTHRERVGPITQTVELANLVCRAVRPKSKGERPPRWMRMHPATKTFQALRIAVNDEINELEEGLSHAISLLAVGGRFAVISFHSLEDRPVKVRFKAVSTRDKSSGAAPPGAAPQGAAPRGAHPRFINLYKRPIVPTREEIARNPSARSAKLRVLERVA